MRVKLGLCFPGRQSRDSRMAAVTGVLIAGVGCAQMLGFDDLEDKPGPACNTGNIGGGTAANGIADVAEAPAVDSMQLPSAAADAGGPSEAKATSCGLSTAVAIPIAAILDQYNGRAYFFLESQYILYDLEARSIADGYPKPIASYCPGVWEDGTDAAARWRADGIDAAITWHNGKIYFFKGSEYAKFAVAKDGVTLDGKRSIQGYWHGLWTSGVDAAVTWYDGKVYFFKGSEYASYDMVNDEVDPGHPKPIASKWHGLWESGIDGAMMWYNGKAYFFKGSEYVRYDIAADRVDDGYPTAISAFWADIGCK